MAEQHSGPLRVIRSYDPAVDTTDLQALARYTMTRDPDLIAGVLLKGARPRVYTVIKPTRAGIRYILNGSNTGDVNDRAFAVCVSSVEGADGRVFSHPDPTGAKAAPETWMENFAWKDVQEIGGVAYEHSGLPDDLPPYYPRQVTSESALTALLFHRAAQTSGKAPPSPDGSDEPAAPPPDPPTS